MTFRAVVGSNNFFAVEADRPLPVIDAVGRTKIRDGAEVIFTDSGVIEQFDAVVGAWFLVSPGSSGNAPATLVVAESYRPEDVTGILTLDEIADVTVAADPMPATQVITRPTPIKRISLNYTDEGSATGVELYLVTGALDDTDSLAKLSNAGTRRIIKLDHPGLYTIAFPSGGPLRVDIASKVAETGASRVYMETVR